MTEKYPLPEWPRYRSGDDASLAIRRRADIKVGCIVFIMADWVRVYRRNDQGMGVGSPIFRYKFMPEYVVGETKMSWLVGRGPKPRKFPKKGAFNLYGLDDVEDAVWADQHQFRIRDAVGHLRDLEKLKQIAELVGYKG